ncbi:hypothetical protein HK101_001571 [Irineochytrium annulatum]|nr:hypothetical protein HK101_001571 [Irineochytrium annulatum]
MTVLANVPAESQAQYLALAAAIRAIVEDPDAEARAVEIEAKAAEMKACNENRKSHRAAWKIEQEKLEALKKNRLAAFTSSNRINDCQHVINRETDLEAACAKRCARLQFELDGLLAPQTRLRALRTDLALLFSTTLRDDKTDYGLVLRVQNAAARREEITSALSGRMEARDHLRQALKRAEGMRKLVMVEIETDQNPAKHYMGVEQGNQGLSLVLGAGGAQFSGTLVKINDQIKDALRADRSIPQPRLAVLDPIDPAMKGVARERLVRQRAIVQLDDRIAIIIKCLNHVETIVADEAAELDKLGDDGREAIQELQERRVAVFEDAIKATGGEGAGVGWEILVADVTGSGE